MVERASPTSQSIGPFSGTAASASRLPDPCRRHESAYAGQPFARSRSLAVWAVVEPCDEPVIEIGGFDVTVADTIETEVEVAATSLDVSDVDEKTFVLWCASSMGCGPVRRSRAMSASHRGDCWQQLNRRGGEGVSLSVAARSLSAR